MQLQVWPSAPDAQGIAGSVVPFVEGSPASGAAVLRLPGMTTSLPWPGGARDETFQLTITRKDVTCYGWRYGGEETLAGARLDPQSDDGTQWLAFTKSLRDGPAMRQEIVTELLRGFATLDRENPVTLSDGELLEIPLVALQTTPPNDPIIDWQPSSWHLNLGGEMWRLLETDLITNNGDIRARRGVLIRDRDIVSRGIENLNTAAAGHVVWASPDDLRFWPAGTVPELDPALKGSDLPAPLQLMRAQLPGLPLEEQ